MTPAGMTPTDVKMVADGDDAPAVFQPSGHPVAWSCAALAALVIALSLTWWAGLLAPRVTLTYDLTNERGPGLGAINGFDLMVANVGPLPVDVVGAGLTGSPTRPVGQVKVQSGDRAVVHLAVTEGKCQGARLYVKVRAPLGTVRRIDVRGLTLGGLCPA